MSQIGRPGGLSRRAPRSLRPRPPHGHQRGVRGNLYKAALSRL